MDCGEATAGQLVRIFGLKGTERILRSLKGVYISHLHADHHMGLVGVIIARQKAFEDVQQEFSKLNLLLPYQVIPFFTVSYF